MQGWRGGDGRAHRPVRRGGASWPACTPGSSTGHGYAIDLALLDCAVAAQVNVAQAYLTSGEVAAAPGQRPSADRPLPAVRHRGRLAGAGRGQRRPVAALLPGCRTADLAADRRFATNTLRVQNRAVLVPLDRSVDADAAHADWEERLRAAEVPHAPVWDYADLFVHPQAAARGLRVTVRDPEGRPVDLVGPPFHIAGTTLPPPTAPPQIGQHTEEILKELLGLDEIRLGELRQKGVI